MLKWREGDNSEDTLWLLTRDEVEKLPNGTVLKSLIGEYETKGRADLFSYHTLEQHGAWGLTAIMAESQGLGSLFTMLMLRS